MTGGEMHTLLICTAGIAAVAAFTLWVALSAVAVMRRGFLETFDPEIDGRSQLFAEDLDTVFAAFHREVGSSERMSVAQSGRSQLLVELDSVPGPLVALRAMHARLRFADVGCGTEVSCAYVRKIRWGWVDPARVAARGESQICRCVSVRGLTRLL